MYCPKCKSEYIEGIPECADCHVPLVEHLPAERKAYPKPAHRIVTLLVIVSVIYFFVLRTMGTFLPGVFANITVARVAAIVSLLAGLTFVLFFINFCRVYIGAGKDRLRSAAALAVFASVLSTLLHAKGLAMVFHERAAAYLARSSYLDAAEVLTPWLGSLLMLYFFVTLHGELVREETGRLKRAALAAIVGSSLGILLQTLILVMYIDSRSVKWLFDLPGRTAIALLPVSLAGFVLVIYFYISFFIEQNRMGSDLEL
jgi:hypothetical protein